MHALASSTSSRATARLVRVIGCGMLVALLCGGAAAQSVRKCQVDGRTVFQAAPCPAELRAAATAPAAPASAAAADPSGGPKKKTLADLLRERDGADRPRPAGVEAQSDGANVLRSRMGAV